MDLNGFMPLNSKSLETEDPADIRATAQAAWVLVRKHADTFAEYLASRLEGTFQVNSSNVQFEFRDEDDARETIKMSLMQSADEQRAKAAAIMASNIMLYDLQYPSMYSNGEDDIAATFVIAHGSHSWKMHVAQMMRDDAQIMARNFPRTPIPSWLPKLALVAVGFVISWLVFK